MPMTTTIRDNVRVTGDAAVDGQVSQYGLPAATTERYTMVTNQMAADATNPATFDTTDNYPGWSFAAGVTEAIVVPFAPYRMAVNGSTHVFWNTFEVALVHYNNGADPGAVRWQVDLFNYAIAIDLVTEAAAQTNLATVNQAPENVQNAAVIGGAFPLSPAFFGSEFKLRIARLGGDAADTVTNAVKVTHVSMNRVS